ncbi:hypothetical protein [Trichlorobacter lovleyi]|uniref:Uncharacterized protein n=1 Tax=Trichlorobacter lovleyi (strain ATCC BAA-1151 / DSM 17278 / SZ) TaxID=398767 RepID=B3EAJ3_TRIL1|nr:hypothetical protein [Trichlorobacter lovleyi]ACD95431.1 conserved hypothetical protein [Trichlorobacter lovleyi SZ]
MKTTATIINTVSLLFASLTTALASAGHGDAVDTSLTYNSGILVLAFAGFLALVVVVQTIPALISLYGMIKGAAEAVKNKEASSTSSNR